MTEGSGAKDASYPFTDKELAQGRSADPGSDTATWTFAVAGRGRRRRSALFSPASRRTTS
jgi:hypothetical protein